MAKNYYRNTTYSTREVEQFLAKEFAVTDSVKLSVRSKVDADDISALCPEYWQGINTTVGHLTLVKEYYYGKKLVYAEFKDDSGIAYSYLLAREFSDEYGKGTEKSIFKQISEDFDKVEPETNNSLGGKKESAPSVKMNIPVFANSPVISIKGEVLENSELNQAINKPKQNQKETYQNSKTNFKKESTMSDLTNFDLKSLETYYDQLEEFIKKVENSCAKMESGIQYCKNGMNDPQCQAILQKTDKVVQDISSCIKPTILLKEKVLEAIEAIKDMIQTNRL